MTQNPAIRFLLDDHKRLTGLFRQFETVDERAPEMREGVIREILMEIEIHSAEEEQLFYPLLLSYFSSKAVNDLDSAALIDRAIQDHREIDIQLAILRSMPLNAWRSADFGQLFAELIRNLEAHMTWEELEILKRAERLPQTELGHAAAQMEAIRSEMLRMPRFESSLPRFVQNPHGGEQKRKERQAG